MKCEDCRKILKEVHPSIFVVTPENEVIKKEQVLKLEREFSLTSINEGKRVYIIEDIDKATASAANSLLKFLEELSGDNYGILITENLYSVILTIRSRSQIVSFDKVPAKLVAEELVARGVDEETSNILSNITNSADECLELINDGKILDLIELAKKIGVNLVTNKTSSIILLYKEGEFLLKESNKKYHKIFLDLLIFLTNDKLYYILDQTENIVYKNTMKEISGKIDLNYEKMVNELEKILEFKQKLKYNINMELFYAHMLIEIAR